MQGARVLPDMAAIRVAAGAGLSVGRVERQHWPAPLGVSQGRREKGVVVVSCLGRQSPPPAESLTLSLFTDKRVDLEKTNCLGI